MTEIPGGYQWMSGRNLLGLALGTSSTNMDLTDDMASGDTGNIVGSVYGSRLWGAHFAHAIVSYSRGDMDSRRT